MFGWPVLTLVSGGCGIRPELLVAQTRSDHASLHLADSPGPSNHSRLGSLRNQINWRRAYRRFSWTMSARVAGSSRTPCNSSSAWR